MKINNCTAIDTCRACGSKNLLEIINLGHLYVSNFVDSSSMDMESRYPLELVLCGAEGGGCGLLQLRHSVNPEKMYRNYWYFSGINKSMKEELAGIVKVAENLVKLDAGDFIIDIGCNDGTLLAAYKRNDIQKIGFEPATNLAPVAAKVATKLFNDFFSSGHFTETFPGKKAKIITAIAMFYDLENPNVFLQNIKSVLDRDGVFIIQMSYLGSMLSENAFDNICHEHLEYYSLFSLENLLRRNALEAFDVELNSVNGGSFRIYVRHTGSRAGNGLKGGKNRLRALRLSEKKINLNGKDVYLEFAKRIHGLKLSLSEFIKAEHAHGKKIYVYGASTKGNTLLQYCGLDKNVILAAAERNPIKWGKKTIGTEIPIISEDEARKDSPDYFLVLPWHFLPEFIEREKNYLDNGGKFIVPLPYFKII